MTLTIFTPFGSPEESPRTIFRTVVDQNGESTDYTKEEWFAKLEAEYREAIVAVGLVGGCQLGYSDEAIQEDVGNFLFHEVNGLDLCNK